MNAAYRTHDSLPSDSFWQDIATLTAPIDLDGKTTQKVLQAAGSPQNPVWQATERGVVVHTQNASLSITGADGLPIENLTCLAQGMDGTIWVGGPDGAARLRDGVWRYFAGKRWLPDNHVHGITVDEKGAAWLETNGGAACIETIPLTWQQKADYYEGITATRHNRDGFVTECLLTTPGDLDSFLYEASDNDGLWTALYVCAACFRYAVTGEDEARQLAWQSMRAMLALVEVTGIPGFPARALARRGERVALSEPAVNWLPSPVKSDVLYKADTSSDEIVGHYVAWYVYWTLAANAAEKAKIAQTCRTVTDHILDNHYTLVSADGKRTSWGVWSPEMLNHDPEWVGERGLNSLEILSHLKVAQQLCPCERYARAYHHLITEHHYALNTVRQKIRPPQGENNHSDDELAACAYYPLLMLETNPHLRALYLLSLETTQATLWPEHSPFHNVVYGACSGKPCDSDAVISWLQDAPLDLRDWTMTNRQRADITFAPELDRFGKRQLTRPLPPGEIDVMKWNRNPYLADSGTGGTREMDGTFWLLPYWMGRYHGLLIS